MSAQYKVILEKMDAFLLVLLDSGKQNDATLLLRHPESSRQIFLRRSSST